MSLNDIQIKEADTWHIYRWDSSDGALYASGLSLRHGRTVRRDSRIGSAASLQDAIVLAKARCNATRHATVKTMSRVKTERKPARASANHGRSKLQTPGAPPVRPSHVFKALRSDCAAPAGDAHYMLVEFA